MPKSGCFFGLLTELVSAAFTSLLGHNPTSSKHELGAQPCQKTCRSIMCLCNCKILFSNLFQPSLLWISIAYILKTIKKWTATYTSLGSLVGQSDSASRHSICHLVHHGTLNSLRNLIPEPVNTLADWLCCCWDLTAELCITYPWTENSNVTL